MRSTVLLALCVVMLGCSYIPTTRFTYSPVERVVPEVTSSLTLGVERLRDARPPKHIPGGLGRGFLTYVPLLPYVKIPYERIDEYYADSRRSESAAEIAEHADFPRQIAAAIAGDLRTSGLFTKVVMIDGDEDRARCDIVLSGTLHSTEFDRYITSYMLGIAGVLLWFLPIPMGSDEGLIDAELSLHAMGSDNVLWSHRLQGEASRMFTLYNSGGASPGHKLRLEIKQYGSNDEGVDGDSLWAYHAAALRSAMGPAYDSLARWVAANPE